MGKGLFGKTKIQNPFKQLAKVQPGKAVEQLVKDFTNNPLSAITSAPDLVAVMTGNKTTSQILGDLKTQVAGGLPDLTNNSKSNATEFKDRAGYAKTRETEIAGIDERNKIEGGDTPFSESGAMINKYRSIFGDTPDAWGALVRDNYEGSFKPIVDQYGKQLDAVPEEAVVNPDLRNYQVGLAQQLADQAQGKGPSIAQMQLQQATDRTLAQALSGIRAATGPNAALAGRTGALAASQQLSNLGAQSGIQRQQEVLNAQQALGDVANQGRSADLSQANLSNQFALNTRTQNADILKGMSTAVSDKLRGTDLAASYGVGSMNTANAQRYQDEVDQKKRDQANRDRNIGGATQAVSVLAS